MRSARAAGARVAIQILYRDRKGPTTRPRHRLAHAAIRPGEGHDTAPSAPRHGWPNAQRALSLGHGCVHTVHLTQF